MSFWARLTRNFLWKSAAEGSRVLLIAYFIVLARALGAEDLGVFSSGYAAAMILASLADLGLNSLLTRSAARAPASSADLFLQTSYVKAATFAAVAVFAALWPGFGERRTLALLFVGVAASRNMLDQVYALCLAHDKVPVEAGLKFLLNALVLGLGLMGAAASLSVETAAALLLAAQLTALAAGLWAVSARVAALPLPPRWPTPAWPASDRGEVAALALIGVALASFSRLDVGALKFFSVPDARIGHYFAAERVIAALGLLPGLLAVAALPVFSDHHHKDPFSSLRRQGRLLALLFFGGGLAGLALAAAAGPLVGALYGEDYADAAVILRWLCLALPFMFVNHMSLNVLIAQERSWRAAAAAGTALGVNALASLAFVPRFGVPGAVASAVAAQGTLTLLACVKLLSESRGGPEA